MANLTTERNTQFIPSTLNQPQLGPFGAAASTKYYKGLAAVLDSSGRPKDPGTVTDKVVGVIAETVDNTSGANDALYVAINTGVFKFGLHGTNPPTVADILKPGYFSDNNLVSKNASDGSLGGIIVGIESDGVWIWVGPAAIAAIVPNPGLTPVTDAITAYAGGGQANAVALTSVINRVTTVGSAADSVKLPVAVPGMAVTVINAAAANSMNVFPATDGYINAGAKDAAFAVAAAKAATFYCAVAGKWNAVLSA